MDLDLCYSFLVYQPLTHSHAHLYTDWKGSHAICFLSKVPNNSHLEQFGTHYLARGHVNMQLEPGFEQPIFWLVDHLLYLLSHCSTNSSNGEVMINNVINNESLTQHWYEKMDCISLPLLVIKQRSQIQQSVKCNKSSGSQKPKRPRHQPLSWLSEHRNNKTVIMMSGITYNSCTNLHTVKLICRRWKFSVSL